MNYLLLFVVWIPPSRALLCLVPRAIRTCCVFMDVRFVLLLFCLPFCLCVQLQVHCGSAPAPGFCGPPHYSASLECVPDVMGGLVVWRIDKPNHQKPRQLCNLENMAWILPGWSPPNPGKAQSCRAPTLPFLSFCSAAYREKQKEKYMKRRRTAGNSPQQHAKKINLPVQLKNSRNKSRVAAP